MKKVEEYIKGHTNRYSNHVELAANITGFTPWLTVDDARKIAEIAKEETIKEVCEWIEKNVYSYTWYDFQQHEGGIERGKLIGDLKKHFEERDDNTTTCRKNK